MRPARPPHMTGEGECAWQSGENRDCGSGFRPCLENGVHGGKKAFRVGYLPGVRDELQRGAVEPGDGGQTAIRDGQFPPQRQRRDRRRVKINLPDLHGRQRRQVAVLRTGQQRRRGRHAARAPRRIQAVYAEASAVAVIAAVAGGATGVSHPAAEFFTSASACFC